MKDTSSEHQARVQPVCTAEGYHYFQPLRADGTFGALCVAEITSTTTGAVASVSVVRPASHKEMCRLCDAHAQYMFWYVLLTSPEVSGMVMLCKPYGSGVSGQPVPYPRLAGKQQTDGSRV